MKATGIVRRVDDLGRIVIPKEIRRTMDIKENDPMEMYLQDDCIIFKHYEEVQGQAKHYLQKAIEALDGKDQNVESMLQTILDIVEAEGF